LLDELGSATRAFAVLHNECDVAKGKVASDVDVAVAETGYDVVRRLRSRMVPHGVELIALWPSDVATLNSFWCTQDGVSGAQLDLLHDPHGRCRYGIRTPVVLDAAQPGERWPRLGDVDALIYQIRKRAVKGDSMRLGALVTKAHIVGLPSVRHRASFVLRASALEDLESTITTGSTRGLQRIWRHEMLRYADRVARPVGFWAHLANAEIEGASVIAGRFDRVLVSAYAADLGRGLDYLRAKAAAQRDRLRPSLVVSVGRQPRSVHLDAVIRESDEDRLTTALVAAMAGRVLARLS
jgi:hypothetical protein